MEMNCKRCGCYIGEYSGHGRLRSYCDNCVYATNLLKDKVRWEQEEFIGTTNISSRMSRDKNDEPDFKKERNVIRKELKELGLQK